MWDEVFRNKSQALQNMMNIVVTATIRESLLSAERLGKEQWDEFVKKRMYVWASGTTYQ